MSSMKKFFRSLMMFTAVLAAVASCNKNEGEDQVPSEGYRYSFAIVDDVTKATLDNEGVLWEANDRVGMFVNTYKGYAKVDVTTTPKSIVLYSTSPIPAGSIAYAYYPYNTTNEDKAMTLINLPNVQQGGATSAMPMAGVPFEVEEEVAANNQEGNGQIKFLNLGSIIDFKIYSSDYSDETVQYVTFQADNAALAGEAYLDLTTVSASDESTLALTWGLGENEYDNVKVNQEVPVASNKADATSIYMVVAPGTYSGTITIGTDVATYTFTYTNKKLARNVVKHYNMNLSNASRVEEVVEVVKKLPYEETFTSSQGDFSIENVTLPTGQSSIWSFDASYGAKVTAYINKTNYASETWLISPQIDLTDVVVAELSFEQCVNRYLAEGDATLWIKKVGDENYTQIANTYPATASNGWSSFEEKTIDLSDYVGSKIVFAFKYISTSSAAGTWEIKNFKVEEVVYTTEFTIAAESINVQVGQTKNNPVSVNSGATIVYSSDDETIATVDEEGNVTGVAEGSTFINVSVPAFNGYPAAEDLYEVIVSKVSVAEDGTVLWSENFEGFEANAQPSKGSTELYGGGFASYAYTGTYCKIFADGTLNKTKEILVPKSSRDENWTVSEIPAAGNTEFTLSYDANHELIITSDVAIVEDFDDEANAYIKKVTVPVNTITFNLVFASATDENTRLDNIVLKVGVPKVQEAQTITFGDNKNVEWVIGTDCTLNTAKQGLTVTGAQTTVTYSSSNTEVATVNNTGIVTPLKAGTVTITDPNAGTKTYTLTLSADDIDAAGTGTSGYAKYNGSHSKEAVAADGTTFRVDFTTNQVMPNSKKIQFQKNNGKLYNTVSLGAIKSVDAGNSSLSVIIGENENPSSASSGGYFVINAASTGAISTETITIVFEK